MKLSELSATPSGSLTAPSAAPSGESELTRDELIAAYRLMLLSRRLDDKEIQLKNQLSLIHI